MMVTHKKKVLMVHNFYQTGGGEHTVLRNEVELLREKGHEVIEYTRNNNELKTSKLKLALMPFTAIWSLKTYREVRRIIKRENIDIVHCHNTFPLISPSVYYAARSLKKPVIQTVHNFRFLCPNGCFFCNGKICEKCKEKNSFKDAVKNSCYRHSKIQTLVLIAMLKFHRYAGTYNKISYIFLTDFNRSKFDGLININSENVFIKPNFINVKTNKNIHQAKGKRFVFAGRLEDTKGIKYLIEYWKALPEEYVLHIYGDGPLKEYVVKETGGIHNVLFLGFKSHAEISEDLAASVAMVFPSLWYEGFPMIIAESMSVGCPVLSANTGNQADIVNSSMGGVTFDINDMNSFIKSAEEIIRLNDSCSKHAFDYYSTILEKEENYRRLIEIYDKAKAVK